MNVRFFLSTAVLALLCAVFAVSCGCGDDDDNDDSAADDADDDADDTAGDDTAQTDDDTDVTFIPFTAEWREPNLFLRPSYPIPEKAHVVLVATRKLQPSGAGCYRASDGIKEIWASLRGQDASEYPESCSDGPELIFDYTSSPMVVPYPNDLYLVADAASRTGYRVQIDGNTALPMGRIAGMSLFSFITKAVNTLNGFSTAADLYLPMGTAAGTPSLPTGEAPGLTDSLFIMTGAASVMSMGATPKRYARLFSQLEKLGLAAEDILSIADFSTLDLTTDLDDVRAALDKMAEDSPPELTSWTTYEPNGPNLQGFANATLHTPIFKDDHGHWQWDENGDPIVQRWEDIQVLFSLPESTVVPYEQPYPLVLYGHGVGDHKESLEVLGHLWAGQGFAFAGIDAVCHGQRAPIPDDPTTTMLCYFTFLSPLNFRDNLRETISNDMWFVRALRQLGNVDMIPEGGDGIPDFDVSHIYYTGISMGSIHGGVLAGLEKNIDAYVMSSAGAKYTGIALEGPYLGVIVDIAQIIDDAMPDVKAEELVWLFGGMFQHVLDAGDPYNFLPHVMKDHLPSLGDHTPQVLQQGAAEDYMLGGLSGAYYARAAGWPQVEPYVWDVKYVEHPTCPYEGSGFYQYDTDEHFWLWMNGTLGTAYRDQALHFLRTHYDTGTAEIIDPLAD